MSSAAPAHEHGGGSKNINLGVRFLLEVAAFVSLGYWGTKTGDSTAVNVILAVAAPLVAVGVWAVFVAPASTRRLTTPLRTTVEFVIFAAAAAGLVAAGAHAIAEVFALLVVVNWGLMRLWNQ